MKTSIRNVRKHLFDAYVWISAFIVLAFLVIIFGVVLYKGLSSLSWTMLFRNLPSPNEAGGGLRNAILGTLEMILITMIISTTVGLLVATYISEMARNRRFVSIVRLANNMLVGTPSILGGILVYLVIVVPMGHYSLLAGSIALSLIAIPMMIRAFEDVLYLVPRSLREAGAALGVPVYSIIVRIVYRQSVQGLITGALLAVARILGESAPLLFTIGFSYFVNLNPWHPSASLPVVIYSFALSPYANWQALAWQGILFITLLVLCFALLARLVGRRRS